MSADLEQAKALLDEGNDTCVLCQAGNRHTSRERGVKPLLTWLEHGVDLRGYSAADKVVGKAAAFLYVLLEVRAVYAPVMSRPAKAVLECHGISASWDVLTEAIRNRTDTGFCPMETAVWDMDDPAVALAAIKKKAMELNG